MRRAAKQFLLIIAMSAALLARAAAAPPTVTYFSPTGGPPGTQVTVVGDNLDNGGAFDAQVTINGVPAQVLKLNREEMLLAVAGDMNTSGSLVVSTGGGATSTTLPFLFSPLSVQVQPGRIQIFNGQSRAITAIPLGSAQGVQWAVNGVVGGNATFGTVTQSLTANFQAPADAPDPATVLVTASMIANPAVRATARVLILNQGDGIPSLDVPPPDPADFQPHPQIGLNISRTRVLVLLAEGATLGPLIPAMSQTQAQVIGGAPEFRIVELAVPDSGDFAAVQRAIDTLTTAPQVLAATFDCEIGVTSLPPSPPLPTAGGAPGESIYLKETSPSTSYHVLASHLAWHWDLQPTGHNWGLEFANFPQAWNWFDYVQNLKESGAQNRVVNVGVADSPILPTQRDLEGISTRLTKGSQVPEGPGSSGHGVHVSTIVGGVWDNKKGITGASPFVNIINQPYGGFTSGGINSRDTMGQNMIVQIKNLLKESGNLRVINMSQGYNWYQWLLNSGPTTYAFDSAGNAIGIIDTPNPPQHDAAMSQMVRGHGLMAQAIAAWFANPNSGHNAVFVAAAGNDRTDIPTFYNIADMTSQGAPGASVRVARWNNFSAEFSSPFSWASYHGSPNVLVAEALAQKSDRAQIVRTDFSNITVPNPQFPNFDRAFIAPGHNVFSASVVDNTAPVPPAVDPDAVYEVMSGTSQAAPHIAGLLAYLVAIDPALTRDNLITILKNTSRPYNSPGATGGPPVIDAFAAVMEIDTINANNGRRKWVKKALVNIDDGSIDGNDRESSDDKHGSGLTPDQMRINMADFRRFRDAYLQTHNMGGALNGPAESPKRDLNRDEVIGAPDEENLYPRTDFNGDGKVELDDLDVMADVELWNDEQIPDAGLNDASLKNKLALLMESGDYKIDADAIFGGDSQIDKIRFKARVKMENAQTIDYLLELQPEDGDNGTTDSRKILTIPAGRKVQFWATAQHGDEVRYFLLSPDNPNGEDEIQAGQDKTIKLRKAKVEIVPNRFSVAYQDRADFEVRLALSDGTNAKVDREFYSVAVQAPPALGSITPTADRYQLAASSNPGVYTIEARVQTSDGDQVNPADDPVALAEATVRTAIIKNPGGLGLDSAGNLYVSDSEDGNITMVPPGEQGFKLLTGLDKPGPVEIDARGRSIIFGEADGRVTRKYFGISGSVVNTSGTLLVGAAVFVDTPAGTFPGQLSEDNRYRTNSEGRFTVMDLLKPEMGHDPIRVSVTIEFRGEAQVFPLELNPVGQTIHEFTFE